MIAFQNGMNYKFLINRWHLSNLEAREQKRILIHDLLLDLRGGNFINYKYK